MIQQFLKIYPSISDTNFLYPINKNNINLNIFCTRLLYKKNQTEKKFYSPSPKKKKKGLTKAETIHRAIAEVSFFCSFDVWYCLYVTGKLKDLKNLVNIVGICGSQLM